MKKQRLRRLGWSVVGLSVAVLVGVLVPRQEAPLSAGEAPAPAAFDQKKAAAFLKTFCVSCHGPEKPKANLDLSPLLAGTVKDKTAPWQNVLERLIAQDMPPRKSKARPSGDDFELATAWLKHELAQATGNAGRMTRRLNRAQYNNTIRDLLFVDARPADSFPQDLGLEGFDHIADVQTLPHSLWEKYHRAAGDMLELASTAGAAPRRFQQKFYPLPLDQIERKAAIAPNPVGLEKIVADPKFNVYLQKNREVQVLRLDYETSNTAKRGWQAVRPGKGAHGYEAMLIPTGQLQRRGEFVFDNLLPVGRYRLTVKAYAEASNVRITDKGPLVEKIPADKVLNLCVLGLDVNDARVATRPVAIGTAPQTYTIEFTTDRKSNTVSFGNATAVNKAMLPFVPSLVLCEAELEGPLIESWPTKSHQAIFGPKGEWTTEEIIRKFVRRAFRRPPTAAEIRQYVALAHAEIKAKTPRDKAVAAALQAVLVSPNFLFLIEETRHEGRLNDHELASRLSYFLWSTMPDGELFRLADQGQLARPEVLSAQVKRMLADPKADALIDNFAGQWLGIRRLIDITPDPTVYTMWDEELRTAIRREPEEFFRHVMRENRSILDFLAADYAFVNQRLALHYGLTGVEGAGFRKVPLPANRQRGGLMTTAAVLTLGAQPTRSSPVQRGAYVLERLFNRPPPNPPANVPKLEEGAVKNPKNLREQLNAHARDASCASCHQKIDPWGLSLETFDGIGGLRAVAVADVTTQFADGRTMVGPDGLRQELLSRKAEFTRGFSEKLLLYALGRPLDFRDREAVARISDATSKENYRFHALIQAVVLSDTFRRR